MEKIPINNLTLYQTSEQKFFLGWVENIVGKGENSAEKVFVVW